MLYTDCEEEAGVLASELQSRNKGEKGISKKQVPNERNDEVFKEMTLTRTQTPRQQIHKHGLTTISTIHANQITATHSHTPFRLEFVVVLDLGV